MSSLPTFNVGGLMSGLDTNQILQQLMHMERLPIRQMEQRQDGYRKVDQAWGQVVNRVSALRSATDGVRRMSSFENFVSSSSSNSDALSVSTSGTPQPGSVDVRVVQLAFATQRASQEGFTALDDEMGTRELSIHVGGDQWDIVPTSETATLEEFVSQINNSGAPVSAQAVKIEEGHYELIITSDETGTANEFTLTETNWTQPFDEVQAAQDSQLRIGDPDTGLLITRSSNTINDVIDGLTLRLHEPTVGAVTVTTSRDTNAAVDAVKKFVDAVNATLSTLKTLTKFDADKLTAGPLTGDSTARQLSGDLATAMSGMIAGIEGEFNSAANVGIELTRDGLVTLDEAKLREALEADFSGVSEAFARSASVDDTRLNFIAATDTTVTGSYGVVVTQAAERPSVLSDTWPPTTQTMEISVGSKTAQVEITNTDTLAQVIQKINDALAAAGISSLAAEDDGGNVRLLDSRYGSNASFTVASDGDGLGMLGTHTGADVIADVDGTSVTGSGQVLTVGEGEDAEGLVMRITASAADVAGAGGSLDLGEIHYTRGLAGNMSSVLTGYEGSTGAISRARDSLTANIEQLDDRIANFEVRLEQRELTLLRQFATMERMLSELQGQSSWLSAQFSQLQA